MNKQHHTEKQACRSILHLIPGKQARWEYDQSSTGIRYLYYEKSIRVPSRNAISFFDSDDQYIITLKNRDKVEEIIDQVCRNGFADFSKEDIKVIIK